MTLERKGQRRTLKLLLEVVSLALLLPLFMWGAASLLIHQ